MISLVETITRLRPVTGNNGITVNSYPPLSQELIIAVVGLIPLVVMFYLMFKTDLFNELFEKIYEDIGKAKNQSYANCKCSRCQFELRTKKGLKKWKKSHKWNKDEMI